MAVSPTHQKRSTCLSYEFALVQGVNNLCECRQLPPAAAHEKVNNIKVVWHKNSQLDKTVCTVLEDDLAY